MRHERLSTCRRPSLTVLSEEEDCCPNAMSMTVVVRGDYSMRTFNLTTDFSPARIRLATSSSVRLRHDLSYVAFEPVRASFSRV